jgi:hypothetical protein
MNQKELKAAMLVAACFFPCVGVFSQSMTLKRNGETVYQVEADKSKACQPDRVFTILEETPQYTGGSPKLTDDLNRALTLPRELKGEVFLWLTVNCKGEAFGFQVVTGFNPAWEEELLRALNSLQHWRPGMHRGQAADAVASLTIQVKRGKIRVKNRR